MEKPWQDLRRNYMTCLACGRRATFRIVSAKRRPTFAATHKQACILTARRWSVFKYLQ